MYHRTSSIATSPYRKRSSQVAAMTGQIGLVFRANRSTDLPSELLASIGLRLQQHGLGLQLQELTPDQLDRGIDVAEWRSTWLFEGLLVYHQRQVPAAVMQRVRASRTPCVWCNLNGSHDCVYYDEHSAAVDAVRELVARGHRRIAFASFRGREIFSDNHYAWRDRLNGYRHAMVEAGLDAYTAIDGERQVRELLDGEHPPTAILTPHDRCALGVLHLAHGRGLQVPRDLSLVTFGDHRLKFPGLDVSTMVAPLEFLGSSAVDLLLRQFELGEPVPSIGIGYDPPVGTTIAPPPG